MFGSEKFFGSGGGSADFYTKEIGNSLKFELGDDAHLIRTFPSAGNRKTWTLSCWIKRTDISNDNHNIWRAYGTSGNTGDYLLIDGNDRLQVGTYSGGHVWRITSTNQLRDTSSWYHIVALVDTTQSTSSDRAKLYINGEVVTSFTNEVYPSLNYDTLTNTADAHYIGYRPDTTDNFSGYLAEVNFIDGSALTPSSFAETKEGIWMPKDVSGLTYGTNGFRLPFTETTSANGFNIVTYSGNGGTQSVEGVGFKPDLVWVKERTSTSSHVLTDSVRGVQKILITNSVGVEASNSAYLTSFNADGFTVGTSGAFNASTDDYVAWCWGGGTNDKTYTVTVVSDSGNKYRFDGHGTSSIALNLTEGATYTFNYPSGHPLRFSTTSDGTHGGGSEYTTGVTYVSSTQVKITVASGAPVLYYYCSLHSGMGGQINTNTTDGPTHAEGTILSRAKPNATYGFSIVTWTGTGSAGTVAHGLGVAPNMIIVKNRDGGGSSDQWYTWHSSLAGDNYFVELDTTEEENPAATLWDQPKTTTVFDVKTHHGVNGNNDDILAYCFADVTGYQKLGSYNGSGVSGNSVTGLGFKPAFLMIKNVTTQGTAWTVWDSTRDPSGAANQMLRWNANNVEETKTDREPTFTSDGFTINGTDNDTNKSGDKYIYLAIADTRDALFTSDASSNSNNWTPNSLQHSDVMPDTPTNGFAVLNNRTSGSSVGTLTEGNLQYKGASGQWESKIGTIGVSSGKWYYEVNPISGSSSQGIMFGITNTSDTYLGQYFGYYGNGWSYYGLNGAKYNNSSGVGYGATIADGDIVGVALDADAGTLTFYKNGVSQGVAYSGLSLGGSYDTEWFMGVSCYGTAKAAINFGQDSSFSGRFVAQGNADDNGKGDFYYAPPSGHLALCNANLPDPATDPAAGSGPEDHFNIALYTGNGGTQSITGVGFQPDWTWIKSRSATYDHVLIDSVRGVEKQVISNKADAETQDSGNGLISFDSDGFTVKLGSSTSYNNSSQPYVAWNWKAGTAFSNSAGTNGADIASTGSVNDNAGFSIISYTGNGSSSQQTIGHGLSTKPDLALIKTRGQSYNWMVLFDVLNGSFDYIQGLNTTAVAANSSGTFANANTLTLLAGSGNVNASGENYICYCFASKDGFSRMGQYIGNGNANGPFMYTGFRPAFVMVKAATGAVQHWWMFDNKRDGYNVDNDALYANLNSVEGTADIIDFYSNGFKILNSSSAVNGSNVNYLVMAFAEQPFKYANAR